MVSSRSLLHSAVPKKKNVPEASQSEKSRKSCGETLPHGRLIGLFDEVSNPLRTASSMRVCSTTTFFSATSVLSNAGIFVSIAFCEREAISIYDMATNFPRKEMIGCWKALSAIFCSYRHSAMELTKNGWSESARNSPHQCSCDCRWWEIVSGLAS